jgi:hypothetical protein
MVLCRFSDFLSFCRVSSRVGRFFLGRFQGQGCHKMQNRLVCTLYNRSDNQKRSGAVLKNRPKLVKATAV